MLRYPGTQGLVAKYLILQDDVNKLQGCNGHLNNSSVLYRALRIDLVVIFTTSL